jgi:PAS domain S-box-containing protein
MSSTKPAVNSLVHILIAEDIISQAHMLRYLLEEEGYQVTSTDNGQSTLELAAALQPSLIISGVKIPQMTGYELCRQIKASPDLCAIPVILVTSLSDPNEVLLGLQCGADSFVIKPYERRHMLARVEHALNNRNLGTTQEDLPPAEIFFHGERHRITASRAQILNLLMSTYDGAMQRNHELLESREQLSERTSEVLAANLFLDSMIEHMPTPFYIKDVASSRYVRVNRAEEALLGLLREDMLGKTAHDIFDKDTADVLSAQDQRALISGVVEDIAEHCLPSRNRGERLLHTRKVPIFNEASEPTHILGISEDITVQKELEKAIAALHADMKVRAADLEAANKSLESFTAAASHDLRSPLSVIGGYAGLLEKHLANAQDDKTRRYLSVIEKQVKSMAKLIDDLLSFSRLSLREIQKENVDMHEMVESIVAEVQQHLAQDKKPSITIGALPTALADPSLLRQVWVNLLSNAVKYSGRASSPQIEVSGCIEGAEAVYSVRDNGAGFSMDNYDKLFGVFERLHTDEEFEGTGVGLASVHRVVTRHGGRVWAEGKVDEGATFHFSLPVSIQAGACLRK